MISDTSSFLFILCSCNFKLRVPSEYLDMIKHFFKDSSVGVNIHGTSTTLKIVFHVIWYFMYCGNFSNDNSYDYVYMYCHPNLQYLVNLSLIKSLRSGMNAKFERSIMVDKLTLTKASDHIVEVPTPDQDPIGNL